MVEFKKAVLGDPQVTGEDIRQACEAAALAAMEEHRLAGVPVSTWDWVEKKVVLRPAEYYLDLATRFRNKNGQSNAQPS